MSLRERPLLVAFLALVCGGVLYGAINRGTIQGTITDPQGAAVPGAIVVVTNVNTNVSARLTTNSVGFYLAEQLVPGTYSVRVTATGFQVLSISNLTVTAGVTSTVNGQLKLGATTQTIQVTGTPALVQTSSSNFSSTVGTGTLSKLALAGRDIQQLVFLFPGVNSTAGPPGSNFGFNSQYGSFPDATHTMGSQLSVNGGQAGANSWYLDGNLDLSGLAENLAVNPSPDSVAEFQVISGGLAPQYGRTGGGVFNMVLKSGTNQLHGNLYEYDRNNYFNARNPFTSVGTSGALHTRQLRYNDFGGTLGGPVVLPHIYNGKDKTFFFFSWDTSILHLIGPGVYTVPTPLMSQGNFSEDPNTQYGLWDPYTTQGPDSNGEFARSMFGTPLVPNGCTGYLQANSNGTTTAVNPTTQTCNPTNSLPLNRLDPVAMFFMKSFPQPNYLDPLSNCPIASGGGYRTCNNFLGTVGSSEDTNNSSIKIDETLGNKNSIFGEWLWTPMVYRNYRVPWTGPTFPWGSTGFGSNYDVNQTSQIVALGDTYVFSPTFVNELRVSWSRQAITTNPLHPYPDSISAQSQVQQVLAPSQIPEDPYFPIPRMNITPPSGGGITFGPPNWVNMFTGSEAFTILDDITKVIGRHTMKAGFMYRPERSWYDSGYGTNFSFNGSINRNPITGLGGGAGLAQFMLGAACSGGRCVTGGLMFQPTMRNRTWGFYWQDEYHVTPHFTLTYGLRYDIFGTFRLNQHPQDNLCLDCANSQTGLPGKIIYEGKDPGFPLNSDFFPPNWNDIAPRINFAWTPFGDQKTVIRGGYNMFYSNAFQAEMSPGQTPSNIPGWSPEYDWNGSWFPNQCAPFTGQCVSFPLSDTTTDKATLTTPPRGTGFPAKNYDPLLGFPYLQFVAPVDHDPVVQMWTLQVQRQLPGNFMVSVGYVGNHGTHLMGDTFHNFNYVHTNDVLKYKTQLGAVVPITSVYSGQTAAELASVYGSSQLPLSTLLTPWPFFGAVSGLVSAGKFDGATAYNGLNVRVQKRFSHGLDFIAVYTWSKKINNAMTDELGGWEVVTPLTWNRPGGTGGRAGALGGLGGGSFQDPDNTKLDRAIAKDDVPNMFNLAGTYQLPFGVGRRFVNRKGLLNWVLGGWELTGNFNAESGVPLSISCPANELTNRCDLIGNPNFSGSRTRTEQIADWINPAAFAPPFGTDQAVWSNYDPTASYAWQWGTMGPQIGTLRSPGFWTLDNSLDKTFHISESKYFLLRWEMFNTFNHQNLGFPNTSFCLPPGPNGETNLVQQAGCSFGRITNIATDPRSMEFAMKFYW
jgi:Carboxypeptidase regulatory-like domain